MMNADENSISVYVANLGKYNEGYLEGGWITLPVPQVELDRFLKDTVGLELDPEAAFEKGLCGERVYEEYAVHDYNFDKGLAAIGYNPSEYDSLDDLNILAGAIADLSDDELEAVRLCADQSASMTALQYANLAVQSDEIPFYGYDFTGVEYSSTWSNEEKYGWTLLENSPDLATLERAGLLDYLDVERYGTDCGYDHVLSDNGYLDCCADFPDMDFYDRDELMETISSQLGDSDYFSKGHAVEWDSSAATRESKDISGASLNAEDIRTLCDAASELAPEPCTERSGTRDDGMPSV